MKKHPLRTCLFCGRDTRSIRRQAVCRECIGSADRYAEPEAENVSLGVSFSQSWDIPGETQEIHDNSARPRLTGKRERKT